MEIILAHRRFEWIEPFPVWFVTERTVASAMTTPSFRSRWCVLLAGLTALLVCLAWRPGVQGAAEEFEGMLYDPHTVRLLGLRQVSQREEDERIWLKVAAAAVVGKALQMFWNALKTRSRDCRLNVTKGNGDDVFHWVQSQNLDMGPLF